MSSIGAGGGHDSESRAGRGPKGEGVHQGVVARYGTMGKASKGVLADSKKAKDQEETVKEGQKASRTGRAR